MFPLFVETASDAFDFLSGIYPEEQIKQLKPEQQLTLARFEASSFPESVKAVVRAREFGDMDTAAQIYSFVPELFEPQALNKFAQQKLLGVPRDFQTPPDYFNLNFSDVEKLCIEPAI